MTGKKIVVALGGNAILSRDPSAAAQLAAVKATAKQLVKLVQQGNDLIITHGNGPQVGNLLLQFAQGSSPSNPPMPLDVADAMTAGSIGYWLANSMTQALQAAGINKEVAPIISQVAVAGDDPAFKQPTKPIGPFFSRAQLSQEQQQHPEYIYREDAGRGYRRVVASPRPQAVLVTHTITTLVAQGIIPIAVGGGGIPVVAEADELIGREAVIDKDLASSVLATALKADQLLILTAVDSIYLDYGKSTQRPLHQVRVSELQQYLAAGQFAPGSMLPKVQAAIEFVTASGHGEAIITSLAKVGKLATGLVGTIIRQ